MADRYYSRKSLCIKGDLEQVEVVGKREMVAVIELFTDDDGVRCADAVVGGLQLSIPLSYLVKGATPPEPPPLHGIYDN